MDKKYRAGLLLVIFCLLVSRSAEAKLPPKIAQALATSYPQATWHRALTTAYEEPDPTKFRGFVTVKKEGIPAERAKFFITWSDYDYRGAVVKDGRLSTHHGKIYTYLKPGDVMAVSWIESSGRTIFLNLISPQVYVPTDQAVKRNSRVTVKFGIRFPREVIANDDAQAVLAAFGEWLLPLPRPTK